MRLDLFVFILCFEVFNLFVNGSPDVNFQLSTYFATVNVPMNAICASTGGNVQLEITSVNRTDLDLVRMTRTSSIRQMVLNFTSSTPGIYIFSCFGTSSFGSSETNTMIIVRSLTQNLDAINITADRELDIEQAMQLLSVLGSVMNAEEVKNNAERAQQVATTTFAVVASLCRTNFTIETASALLSVLESVENLPALAITTTSLPLSEQMKAKFPVSELIVKVSQSIDKISLNLVKRTEIGAPPTLIQSQGISITTVAIVPNISNFSLELLPNVMVTIHPANESVTNGRIGVGGAVRTSRLRTNVPDSEEVDVDATPLLNSDIINLILEVEGHPVAAFNKPLNFVLATSRIPTNAENVCVFLDEIAREFTQIEGIINSTSSYVNATSCRTSKLGSFGILVRRRSVQPNMSGAPLSKKLVALCILMTSLIFLILSIIFFLISAKTFFKVEANILYFNYTIALILATGTFIVGYDSVNKSEITCILAAFLLHYTWLTVFSWCFAISLFMVYILFFGILNRKRIWWLMLIIGWGLPVPFVIPTAAVGMSRSTYITNGDYCFPSYTNGLIWGFLVPFIFLILASTLGGVLAAVKIFLTILNKKEEKPQHFQMAKNMVLTILALLPILSIPWIIVLINALYNNPVVEWVAILVTAPTGLVFFFVVVVRNKQIQEVIFRKKPKEKPQTPKQIQMPGTLLPTYTLPSRAKRNGTGRDMPASILKGERTGENEGTTILTNNYIPTANTEEAVTVGTDVEKQELSEVTNKN